jgi:hypothetical protein
MRHGRAAQTSDAATAGASTGVRAAARLRTIKQAVGVEVTSVRHLMRKTGAPSTRPPLFRSGKRERCSPKSNNASA